MNIAPLFNDNPSLFYRKTGIKQGQMFSDVMIKKVGIQFGILPPKMI
jgi:hypothetical protein